MQRLLASGNGRPQFDKLVTRAELMLPVLERTSRAAQVDSTVLITGESGTGKELVAEAIHGHSPRRNGPFVTVNMAAVPENLIESELFGHFPGAFTGSTARRMGRFEVSDGGTLLIDEIGDLSLDNQAKVLRVLENHRVTPVGSNEERSIDVRVIAATNRYLEHMVGEGSFREDLYYYRLNVVAISLPPLRARPEDIELLTYHFLDEFSVAYGIPRPEPDRELMEFLQGYHWPGNVRQLRNCIESAIVMANRPTLTVNDLPEMVKRRPINNGVHLPNVGDDITLEAMERALILQRLERWHGNRLLAAKSLGISVRTLQRRLRRWLPGSA